MSLESDLKKLQMPEAVGRSMMRESDYWQNLYRAADEMLSMYGDGVTLGYAHGHLADEAYNRMRLYVVDWAQEDGMFIINHKRQRHLMTMVLSSCEKDRWHFVDDEDFHITIDPRSVKHTKMASGRYRGALELTV